MTNYFCMLEIKRTRMHCNAHRFQNFSRVSSLYLPCPLEWLTHFEFRTCPYTASFVATQWCSRLYDFLLLNYFVLKNSCSSEIRGFVCFQIHSVANYLPCYIDNQLQENDYLYPFSIIRIHWAYFISGACSKSLHGCK